MMGDTMTTASTKWPALRLGLEQIPNVVGGDGGLRALKAKLEDPGCEFAFFGVIVTGGGVP